MRFRKKPVEVEAVQWDGGNIGAVMSLGSMRGEVDKGLLFIETLEGRMRADPGDWIIRGVKGEFYPCKPDIFAATYEPAEDPPSEANCAARPISEWTDDDGDVLLWRFPINEPPRVGSLLDTWWKLNPHYYTHWTPLPKAPSQYVNCEEQR